jgi:hypothetical protein
MRSRHLHSSPRLRLAILFLVIALLTVTRPGPIAWALPQDDSQISRFLYRYDRFAMDPATALQKVQSQGTFSVPTPDGVFNLVLVPNDIRDTTYRAEETIDGGLTRSVRKNPSHTFRGTVPGNQSIEARFTIRENVIEGLLITPQEWYFIEPVSNYTAHIGPSEMIAYRASDIRLEAIGACSTSLVHRIDKSGEIIGPQLSAVSAISVADIATEADYEYVTALGGSNAANDAILEIMNQVDGIYTTQLSISLRVVFQHTWATERDPFSSTAPPDILDEFRKYWTDHYRAVDFDIAHMWTGKDMDDGTVGIAYQDVMCNSRPYSFSLSKILSYTPGKYIIAAHEIGHNLGATHPDQASPPNRQCSNTIMNSHLGSSSAFCQYSKDEISTHLSRYPGCLPNDTDKPQPDTTPPIITEIEISGLSPTGAIISWTTNEAANSQIEYGLSREYGITTDLDSTTVTSHAQMLSGLTANTQYYYRVRSRDSAGNLGVSPTYIFVTPADFNTSTFFWPVPAKGGSPISINDEDNFTGTALVNLDTAPSSLVFTLYDKTGAPLSGLNITNPVTKLLQKGEKISVSNTQIFGDTLSNAAPLGWIQVESTTPKIAGLFTQFNSSLTRLDSAEMFSSLIHSFVLPDIGDKGMTKLEFANPNAYDTLVEIDLVQFDGTMRGTTYAYITKYGALSAELYGELFPGIVRDPSAYLRVKSQQALLAYATLGMGSKDIAVVAGQDTESKAKILYSPQYVMGGSWRSALSLINLDSTEGSVSIGYFPDGTPNTGYVKSVTIPANGKIYIPDLSFFEGSLVDSSEQFTQGYIEVISNEVRLAGSTVFKDSASNTFISALPLISRLQKTLLFSHVPADHTYFSGIAILNPNDMDASATFDLYETNGTLQASASDMIKARQKKSWLLTQLFPDLNGKDRAPGYLRITTNAEVVGCGLFGTNDLSVLSAIPAQSIP